MFDFGYWILDLRRHKGDNGDREEKEDKQKKS